jgi:LPXTG-motif cell wall-anchored protein
MPLLLNKSTGMEINTSFIVLVVLAAAALIAFLIWKNNKDKKQLEQKIKDDYRKPPKHSDAEDPDDLKGT